MIYVVVKQHGYALEYVSEEIWKEIKQDMLNVNNQEQEEQKTHSFNLENITVYYDKKDDITEFKFDYQDNKFNIILKNDGTYKIYNEQNKEELQISDIILADENLSKIINTTLNKAHEVDTDKILQEKEIQEQDTNR